MCLLEVSFEAMFCKHKREKPNLSERTTKMIYGYIRVSTDKQILENQEFEIENFCQRENILIDKWVRETISGTRHYEKRKLGRLLKGVKAGDIVVCSEISRLGRNLLRIMAILNVFLQKGAQVWTIKDNYRLGADIQSKVLAFAFALAVEIERNLISQRTKEALARVKADGRVLGRQHGSKNRRHILDGKAEKLLALVGQGVSKARIAQQLGVSTFTVYEFLRQRRRDGD